MFFVPPNNKKQNSKRERERPTKTKDSLDLVWRKKKCVHTNRRALISFIKGFMHAWFMLSFFTTWLHMIGEGGGKRGEQREEEEEEERSRDGMEYVGQGVHTPTQIHT